MMKAITARLAVACGLLGGTAAMCAAQTYTPPPPQLTTLPPCPVEKDAKKRAKRKDCDPTVYPSETLETKGKNAAVAAPPSEASGASAAKAHPYPGDNGKDVPYNSADDPEEKDRPVPPHDPAAEKRAADTPGGKANPFPAGSSPDMPTDGAEPGAKSDSGASSSSSSAPSSDSTAPDASSASSSSSDSAARKGAKNPDDDDEDKPKLTDKGSEGRRSKKVIKPQSDTDRVDEDLSVAKFYGQSGNFTGAYLRAKDAVKTQPEYPEGHFALGEAAKRLKKNDEAVAEFQEYLKLAPDGPQAKAAEKALEDLK